MRNKLKILLTSFALILGLAYIAVPLSGSVSAQAADIKNNVCGGVEIKTSAATCSNGTAESTALNTLIANIVNVLSIIVGIVAVIMIILGGFKYITSGGDSGSISSAKTTIIYAIVGLVIVALAQVIVKFVLSKT